MKAKEITFVEFFKEHRASTHLLNSVICIQEVNYGKI